MKVVLELRDQPSNVKKVTIRHDVVIGRGAECNLRLSAPQVSRRHCFLHVGQDSAYVSDLESSNGTWLNGIRLSPGKRYVLKDGMELTVGPVLFVARVDSTAAAEAPLEVRINDARIESEGTAPGTSGAGATAADVDQIPAGSLSFSVEQAGPSAEPDEVTADDPAAAGSWFTAGADDDSEHIVDSREEIIDLGRRLGDPQVSPSSAGDDEQSTIVASRDSLKVANEVPNEGFLEVVEEVEIIDADVVEAVEVIEDADVVDEIVEVVDDPEVLDEVVEVVDDVEVVDVVEEVEVVDVIEDVEVLDEVEEIVDDEVEVVDDEASSGDDVESELRDFLKGLE